MKESKRLITLLLVLCLVLSMLPAVTSAEPASPLTYDFKLQKIVADAGLNIAGSNLLASNASTKIIPQLESLHADGTIRWNYKNASVKYGVAEFTAEKYGYILRTRAVVGDWLAFELDNPGCGKWKLSLEHLQTAYGAKQVNVYILPGTTKDIEGALKPENVTQVVDFYSTSGGETPKSGYASTNTEFTVDWTTGTVKANPSYIIVFEVAAANDAGNPISVPKGVTSDGELAANMYFLGLTATLLEAGEEEPEEDDGSQIDYSDTLPIGSNIAYEDVVKSVNCLFIATDTIDGVDYLYMFFDGNKLSVYNLDTGELYDRENNCFNTPRSFYIAEDHTLWVTGSSNFLYKYNPITKESERIQIPEHLFPGIISFNAWGITSDGNGNLYFATYDRCYLGKYNIASGEFFQIGDDGVYNEGYEDYKDEMLLEEGIYSGNGGLILRGNYVYLNIDNKNINLHEIIKADITTGEVVERFDISAWIGNNTYPEHMELVGDVILCSGKNVLAGCLAVDISGETMQLAQISGMDAAMTGAVSEEIDGKVYFMDSGARGLLEYDIATGTVTETGIANSGALKCTDCLVTVEGNDKLPGESLVTVVSSASLNRADLVFYNLTTKETVTLTDYTDGLGSGNSLRSMAVSEDGKTIYIGAYGNNQLAIYDVESGEVVKLIPTVNTQIESMIWYDGYMYTGNYSSCSINKVDVQTGKRTLLVNLRNSAFSQYRIHATALGEGKVFFGTAPSTARFGGVLTWYDTQLHRVYVAAGPTPEDVYYQSADTPNDQIWFSAVDDSPAPFAGSADKDISEGVQRFTGVIENQVINTMVYQDGYLIGSTSRAGGSGGNIHPDKNNACIFVYDVAGHKLVGTYDLADTITGLTQYDAVGEILPVEFIDTVVADPDVPGKFWGVVSDTLFSFTVDTDTGSFDVKVELSYGTTSYNHGSNLWQGRSLLFDGDFMYVVFGSYGTFMIHKDDMNVVHKVSDAVPKQMVQAYDGNLYYEDNATDLKVLYIAKAAQLIKDPYEAAKVQALIDALVVVTAQNWEAQEPAVIAARKAYDALSDTGKGLITDLNKLTDAEQVIAPLRADADLRASQAVISLIDAIGTVSLESETAIVAARTAYDALTDAQKAMVTNYSVLTAAEATLYDLKIPPADRAAAAVVVDQINAIGTVTLGSKQTIAAARAAYDALTDLQKSLVTNLNVLTAAEETYAQLKAASEIIYDFDYKNLPLSTGGNSLYNKEDCVDLISKYYSEGAMNWKIRQVSFTSNIVNDVVFNGAGYFQGRAVPGDWVAFTLKAPGEGVWAISQNHLATFCGAEEVEVYILPGDTEDIAAALTEGSLIGSFNCYDGAVQEEKPNKNIMQNKKLSFWSAEAAQEYIVVYRCAKANADALAREEADPAATRDYGSNMYFAQLILNKANADTVAVQEMIDSIGTVTAESKDTLRAIRRAYKALTSDQKALVDTEKLVAAEAVLDTLTAAEEIYNFDLMNQGLSVNKTSLDDPLCIGQINTCYAAGELNWQYLRRVFTLEINNPVIFVKNGGYFRGRSNAGDWIAFSIDNPGAGPWELSVSHPVSNTGAQKVNVYILSAGTDIPQALTAQEGLVGSYSCYSSTSTEKDEPSKDSILSTPLTGWTAQADTEYIVVFQAAQANEKGTARIFLSQLSMAEVDETATAVQSAIAAIGTVTLDSEAAIKAARTGYDALSDGQKAQVTNLAVLTAAEEEYARLSAEKKLADDKAAAAAVQAKIDAIGTVTLESKAAIDVAQKAYDALTADQKKLVNTAALEAAQAEYNKLKAAADKITADKAAAAAVQEKIDAIGTVTLDSEAAIKAARAAFDALNEAQKKLVDITALTAAEAQLAALQKDAQNPYTGDPAPLALCVAAALLSLTALVTLLTCENRKRLSSR